MKYLVLLYSFCKRLVFFLLNKFYLFIAISLTILLCFKFALQSASNQISKLEQSSKIIMIDISLKEAKIGEIIVSFMDKNMGKAIDINEVEFLEAKPLVKKTFLQKVKNFFSFKNKK